jgi:hypothetical protein
MVTSPRQVFAGLVVGLGTSPVRCTGCQEERTEGQSLVVYVYRTPDGEAWDLARDYCPACAPETVSTPTLGTSEVLVEATLGTRSVPTAHFQRLCLNDVLVRAYSSPREGAPA